MGDLRAFIGGFFVLVGLIVTATGVVSNSRAPLETVNLNLYSGLTLLVFGGILVWLSRRRA